jgi:hypothetical protein
MVPFALEEQLIQGAMYLTRSSVSMISDLRMLFDTIDRWKNVMRGINPGNDLQYESFHIERADQS